MNTGPYISDIILHQSYELSPNKREKAETFSLSSRPHSFRVIASEIQRLPSLLLVSNMGNTKIVTY